jgi:organic hydroperoxide reductase OsmC/OhrA
MATIKALRFPAQARWHEGRVLELSADAKPPLAVATPPEFKHGVPGVWSPEELLVGAVASCYELTLVAIAERLEIPLGALSVAATGHVESGERGYGFTVIELDVTIETDPTHEAGARRAAELAQRHCIVERALDVPVHVRVAISSTLAEPAGAAP